MSDLNKNQIQKLTIKGFKSFADTTINLRRLNILIGANGVGKSNFISFFRLIQNLLDKEGKLQSYISKQGGPDAILHFGRKVTSMLEFSMFFGQNGYSAALQPTVDNRLMFANEAFFWDKTGKKSLGSGHFESKIYQGTKTGIDKYVLESMTKWRVYHFHDTSESSLIKGIHNIQDNMYLRGDGSNLAAFLYLLQQKYNESYQKIINTIRMVAPFFGNFCLRPSQTNSDKIELEWFERDQDIPWKAHILSDGTLRFISLTTVLLQPTELQPSTILVDEPELGLHPYAIGVLGALIRSLSKTRQLIISTQSADLLDEFEPDDILVVNRNKNTSEIERLSKQDLDDWLIEYSLAELWKRNFIGGRPL